MASPFLRIGTRGSKLALAQAEETRARLAAVHGLDPASLEIVAIQTTGDKVRDRPLAEIGGKGLFTKEIEEALLAGHVDLAVHSMKDMPAKLPGGLVIAALLPREDPRDALLCPVAKTVADLPPRAHVGSSSVRRSAQLRRIRSDLEITPFRGNVGTRLRKLDEGEVDATILACAGLNRLGLADRITAPIPIADMLPAVAQGAVGIEIRETDARTRALVEAIHHRETGLAVAAERAFLAVLDGSCRTPLAGHAVLDGETIALDCEALTVDGRHVFRASRSGATADADRMGVEAGREIAAAGGALLGL